MIPRHRIIPTVLGSLACLSVLIMGILVGTGGRMPSLSFGDTKTEVSSFTVLEKGHVTTIDQKVYLKVPAKTVRRKGHTVTLPATTIPVTSTGTIVRSVPVAVTLPGRTLTWTVVTTRTVPTTIPTTVIRTVTVPVTQTVVSTTTQTQTGQTITCTVDTNGNTLGCS